MTDVEKDILARFNAIERVAAYLLAGRLRQLPLEEAAAVKRSMSGYQLKDGGNMGEDATDEVSILADAHAERLVSWAAEMEMEWRARS